MLEKYYAVLPLPHLSDEIKRVLPKTFLQKRKTNQILNGLLVDDFPDKEDFTTENFQFSRDKKIITAVWITLIKNIQNGNKNDFI